MSERKRERGRERKRERGRERKREGENERKREGERDVEYGYFYFKRNDGCLAPFNYLVFSI